MCLIPEYNEGSHIAPSDDAEANNTVAGLIEKAGFKATDAGPLVGAHNLEPLAGLLI
jgi:predicted dinucleotide-binding enzyme